MNKHLAILNIAYSVIDLFVCLAACACFFFTARYFGRWWIMLFCLIPLLAFNSHSLVIDEDIRQAKLDALNRNGGEDNAE